MKLERWSLLIETIGSIGIILTLIILILEVRTNAELSRVSAYRAGVIGEADWARIRRVACPDFLEVPAFLLPQRLNRMTDDFAEYLQTECVE